jgi:hypothetical protein
MRGRVIVALAVGFWLAATESGRAAQTADDLKVTAAVTGGAVSASFTAGPAVGSDIRPLVDSGLSVTLTFTVDLKRPATAWWDRTVHRELVASTIKFDTLSGTYHVSRLQQGHVVWSDRVKEFAEAREQATTFEGIPLPTAAPLDANAEYYIEVRMTTSPRRTFGIWPFSADAAAGRATFTFIR